MQTPETTAAGASRAEQLAAKHTPGPVASLDIALRIGQHVRHRDFHGKRVTGIVRVLTYDSDNGLRADIALDEPIIIPARDADEHELRIYSQYVPAHELAPFDEREELIGELVEAARAILKRADMELYTPPAGVSLDLWQQAWAEPMRLTRAAIAKATGSAS